MPNDFHEKRNGYDITFNGHYYTVTNSKGKAVYKSEYLDYCRKWCDRN